VLTACTVALRSLELGAWSLTTTAAAAAAAVNLAIVLLMQTAFSVARTMFETAGLPAHLAEHVKAMDEVTHDNTVTFAL
jgi:hypothetical protein